MKYIYLSIFSFILFACSSAKHLKDGQYLLGKQTVVFKEKVDVSKQILVDMQKQKANKKLFGTNVYPWIYYVGVKFFDTTRIHNKITRINAKYAVKLNKIKSDSVGIKVGELYVKPENLKKYQRIVKSRNKKITRREKKLEHGNFFMRAGKEIVVYDDKKTKSSALKMQNYLKTIGYFNARVEVKTKVRARKKSVKYEVNPGNSYLIDSVELNVGNENIKRIIESNIDQSFLKKNKVYNQNDLRIERDRITNLLYNNGYFRFKKNDIVFFADSTKGKNSVWIKTSIKISKDESAKVYSVDSVNFIVLSDSKNKNEKTWTKKYKGVNFIFSNKNYRPKPLELRTLVKPNQIYNKSLAYNTQLQLSNLDAFRFVRMQYDTLPNNKLIASIYATPQKRFQANTSVGLDFIESVPGPYINLGLKNRNFLKGLEILQLNFRYGLEASSINLEGNKTIAKNKSLGTGLSLQFPRFMIFFSEKINSKLKFVDAKTNLSINYNYLERSDLFKRWGTTATFGYSWKNNKNDFFQLKLAEIGLIDSKLNSSYKKQLQGDNGSLSYYDSLIYSPSFIASTSFTATMNYNLDPNKLNKGAYLRFLIESGGAWLNWIGRDILNKKELTYYQFLKLEVDFRKYFSLGWNTTIALRANNGVSYGYGKNKLIPLEKGFILGGMKMRGWGYGQIGPGSYNHPEEFTNVIRNGAIQLYGSAELRQHVAGNFGITLFTDIGNVWNVHENVTYKGGKFETSKFYEEFAISTGYSLNYNISQLILYLGVGMKLRDPRFEKSDRWIHKGLKWNSLVGGEQSEIFLGIGYTF